MFNVLKTKIFYSTTNLIEIFALFKIFLNTSLIILNSISFLLIDFFIHRSFLFVGFINLLMSFIFKVFNSNVFSYWNLGKLT